MHDGTQAVSGSVCDVEDGAGLLVHRGAAVQSEIEGASRGCLKRYSSSVHPLTFHRKRIQRRPRSESRINSSVRLAAPLMRADRFAKHRHKSLVRVSHGASVLIDANWFTFVRGESALNSRHNSRDRFAARHITEGEMRKLALTTPRSLQAAFRLRREQVLEDLARAPGERFIVVLGALQH